jgi:hypothetical protein
MNVNSQALLSPIDTSKKELHVYPRGKSWMTMPAPLFDAQVVVHCLVLRLLAIWHF